MLKIFFILCKEFYNQTIDIIFPEFCIGCHKIGTLLCYSCYEEIEFLQFALDISKLKEKNKNWQLDSVTCCSYYQGITKKIVHELKYHSVLAVGKLIAHLLYYTTHPPPFDLITFVPIHAKKQKQRGFNQSQVIAQELGQLFQKPVACLLVKMKQTKSQMSIHQRSQREKNIIGSIVINTAVPKRITNTSPKVLLIDDVFTSGNTLNYCATILKQFGFEKVHGLCFAHEG